MARVRRHPRVAKREVEVVRRITGDDFIGRKRVIEVIRQVATYFLCGFAFGYVISSVLARSRAQLRCPSGK